MESAFGVDHGEISKRKAQVEVINVGDLMGKTTKRERLKLLGPQKKKNQRRTVVGGVGVTSAAAGYAAGRKGEFGKGLPSRLRTSASDVPGWEGNAMIHRRNAHHAGTQARGHHSNAKKYGTGEWAGMAEGKLASQGRYYGTRSKNQYKEALGEIQRFKARGKKKRVLP